MNFNEINLQENLKKAIDEMGFVELTPVQEEAYKIIMEDRDVLAQSQTGTGKTAAFLVPIMQLFLTNEKFKGGKALVVVPTRELAVQVEKEAKKLNAYLDFNVLAVYGGVGYQKQEEELEKGADFIIATPGRLIDFKKSGKIDLKEISAVVIDEADRLFDMGFLPDLTYILKAMVPPTERRTMLFSATLGTRVGNLSWEFMHEPGEIIIEPEHVTIDLVKQELYHVSREEKMSLLLGLIKKHNPQSGLIFTNTKGMAYEVSQRLEANGYKARYLIGDMPQSKRNAVMESMKRGEIPFLVATDVAARGLHINDLEMVFNYDLPDEAESYVHRIGRTGRAGKEGHAISLACETFVLGLPAIESYIEMKIPVVWAEDEVFVEDASAGKRYRLDDIRAGGRGGRDGRRDNRAGGQRGQRGGRDNRRDNRDGGQRGRDNRGGQRDGQRGGRGSGPQHRDDSRAASVVDMAAGSIDAFGKDGNKKSASPGQRGRDNRGGQRDGQRGGERGGQHGGDRGGQGRNNRNYQKGRGRRPDNRNFDGESSISGDLSVEDRLAYYKRKYGDDFKPTEEMLKKDKAAKKKSGKKGGKAPQGNKTGGQRGGKSGKGGQGGKGKNAPKGQSQGKASGNKAPRDGQRNNQKPAAKAPEKKSFIKKLFGKK